MTMKLATRVFAGALFASLAVAGQAAEKPKFDVGGSLIGAFDTLKNATNQSTGFNLQGGAEFAIQENLAFRLNLGINSFGGSHRTGVLSGTDHPGQTPVPTSGTFSLRSYQASGDFLFATGVTNLRWVFGLSLNRYLYKLTVDPGYANPMGFVDETEGNYHDAFAPSSSFAQVASTKIGARLGLEYRIMPNLSASLLVQQTEMGSNLSDSHKLNVNPAWLELGVKYHF